MLVVNRTMVVPMSALLGFATMMLLGILLPVGGAILWKVKKKQPFWVILIGAAMFMGAVLIIEQTIHALILKTNNPVGNYIVANPLVMSIYGGLMAGLFEETARLFAFKVILKKRTERRTAISYGIGHGGFEVMATFVTTGATYLIYGILMNLGLFQKFIVEPTLAAAPEQAATLAQLQNVITTYNFGLLGIAAWERVGAVLIHLAASILVFAAVRTEKKWLYPVAILLHAGIDVIAGFYQVGWINNVYLLETIVTLWGAASFALAYFFVYKKLPVDIKPAKEAFPVQEAATEAAAEEKND